MSSVQKHHKRRANQPHNAAVAVVRKAERNRLIAVRYWWLTEQCKLRTSYVIEVLAEREFFLTERYIMRLICSSGAVLRELKASPPSVQQLRTQYPSYAWLSGISI